MLRITTNHDLNYLPKDAETSSPELVSGTYEKNNEL